MMRSLVLASTILISTAYALPPGEHGRGFRQGANHHLGDDSFVHNHGRAPPPTDREAVRIPVTVRHLVLTQRQWTLRLAREVSGAPWSLEPTLGPEWDRFESLVEDPPTPGTDLVHWLERAAPDLLGELLVTDRGELDSDEPIIAAARRQQRLRRSGSRIRPPA